MATQVIGLNAPTALATPTLRVFADGSDTQVSGSPFTLVEATNRKGYYEVSFTGTLAGLHQGILYTGSSPIGWGWVTLANASATYVVASDRGVNVSWENSVSNSTITTINANIGTTAPNTAQTGDSFARIGLAGVGLSNISLPSAGLANVTAWTVAITGNITGNLSGTVGSVTGNVGGSVASVVGLTASNLDATVSSRLATSAYTAPLTAATTRSAIGMASANLDTQLAAIDADVLTRSTFAGGAVASVTGNVGGNVAGSVGSVTSAVNTNANATETAIKAKTDNLPVVPAAVGDIPTAAQNADALLARDGAGGAAASASGNHSVAYYLQGGMPEFDLSVSPGLILGSDDTTVICTLTYITSPVNPIVSGVPA